jgi:hypothetical protein
LRCRSRFAQRDVVERTLMRLLRSLRHPPMAVAGRHDREAPRLRRAGERPPTAGEATKGDHTHFLSQTFVDAPRLLGPVRQRSRSPLNFRRNGSLRTRLAASSAACAQCVASGLAKSAPALGERVGRSRASRESVVSASLRGAASGPRGPLARPVHHRPVSPLSSGTRRARVNSSRAERELSGTA